MKSKEEVEVLVRAAFPRILDGTIEAVNKDFGGLGMCTYATRDLLAALDLDYSRSHLWMSLEFRSAWNSNTKWSTDIPDNYPVVESPRGDHCVALVHGWVVDLTARQYDADLPFPYIWRPSSDPADWSRR